MAKASMELAFVPQLQWRMLGVRDGDSKWKVGGLEKLEKLDSEGSIADVSPVAVEERVVGLWMARVMMSRVKMEIAGGP